ncbi:MAG: AmmeMemoRadiSam system protein B [Syntrophales bacterium]|nr:AmmeMemoRadiSam system protein B [Syntrophales bacterium]
MKKWRLCLIIITFFLMLGDAMVLQADKEGYRNVRPSAVAGKFYPETADVLKQAIDAFMADARPVMVKKPLAIIAPHAGYIFSGQICADAYNQVRGNAYDTVVILGTNHTSPYFDKISLYPGDGFETPLGTARIDEEVVSELVKANADCRLDSSLHEKEHSVEVQVPFIQVLFPQAKIVPVIIGRPDVELCRRFGESLAGVLKGRRALIVASTDLSHYPSYKDAVMIDHETLDAITKMDIASLHTTLAAYAKREIKNLHTEACGEAPIMAAMAAAKGLGAQGASVISYANSGDLPVGDSDRVVGYGAVVLTEELSPAPAQEKKEEVCTYDKSGIQDKDKKVLLAFARKTITQFLKTQMIPLARGFSPSVQNPQGVFVTLKKRGALRGCIGRIIPDAPLCKLVGAMALQSAFNDTRFSPVTLNEMKDIEIELSVLTPIKSVSKAEDIVVGRDGVIIQKEGCSAVFLPQVAPEQGWKRDEMLKHLCLKAGLPADGWKSGAQFSTFEAIVFSESDFK